MKFRPSRNEPEYEMPTDDFYLMKPWYTLLYIGKDRNCNIANVHIVQGTAGDRFSGASGILVANFRLF